ncbi:MAG: tetratricopeptide repeat protein [Campylobacteraceae bacterium]|nr:tetratricopeptide repeat protein [Campylobacteraceae bacterium]
MKILEEITFIFPEIYIGYANTQLKLQKYSKAIKSFKKSLHLKENLYESYYGIAIAYEKLTKYKKSIKFYKKTIHLNKSFIPAYNNLGNLYQSLNRYKKANKTYKKALKIDPHNNILLDNIATLYQNKDNYNKAIVYHKLALDQKKITPSMYYNYALALLMTGNLKLGFKYYEYRLHLTDNILRSLSSSTKWEGNRIKGKKLFIFTEQGFGDSIQFIRYISHIKQISKAIIILKCPNVLLPLFENIKEIDYFIKDSTVPNFDFFLPLMSSVFTLNNTLSYIPNKTPYLKYKKSNIAQVNKNTDLIRVGLAWRGNPENSNNKSRSIPLKEFKDLLSLHNCQFYSLQKDYSSQDVLEKYNIIDLSKNFNDFNDTADYISNLDLIISIDSVIAHLSLALNKPTWVLLSEASDYRWSQQYPSSTWYPNAVIYKKNIQDKSWKKILGKIKINLLAYGS